MRFFYSCILFFLMISLSMGLLHAQKENYSNLFESLIYTQTSNTKDVDSTFNALKRQALEQGKDSLYIELTFEQIRQNGGLLLYGQSNNLLENLLINENYFLKKHPKLLIRCVHDLGLSYLLNSRNSTVNKDIAEHYYKRYFELLKQIPLNPQENTIAQQNRLRYLVHTKNDSLFYYLDKYNLNEKQRALYLNHWYKEVGNPKKELEYALTTSNKINIISAHLRNENFKEVHRLFLDYIKESKDSHNRYEEHQLYSIMAQSYLMQNNLNKAEDLFLKALNYFENNTSSPLTETIYLFLIDLQSKINNLEKYKLYSSKYLSLLNLKKDKQLLVLKNHLDYSTKISNLEIDLINEEEAKKIEGFKAQINKQKTIISFALGLIIVTLVFLYFYAVNSKTRADLEDTNKQMVIDVLRSKFKPHFTFNILSVINYFVEKKEMKSATMALTKMSSLLRATLDNMNQELVSYESEYNICKNYMFLESLRFSEKFDYKFQSLENPEIKQWKIPPGIIEPILENAVNHAFKGLKYKGEIRLNHKLLDPNTLRIIVEDNGVGFKPSVGVIKKKSHGLKITQDYIKSVSRLYKKPLQMDFFLNQGTKVVFTIPKLSTPIFD